MNTLPAPHKLLWYSIPLLFILAFVGRDNTIDLQYHDTYFIISLFDADIVLSFIAGINGLLYYLLRDKKTNQMLVWVQVVMTISICMLCMISGLIWKDWVGTDYQRFKIAHQSTYILIFLLLLSQILFVIVFWKTSRQK
jgi:heme/copper-type cytochrome/quinol oxidase subunit 1